MMDKMWRKIIKVSYFAGVISGGLGVAAISSVVRKIQKKRNKAHERKTDGEKQNGKTDSPSDQ